MPPLFDVYRKMAQPLSKIFLYWKCCLKREDATQKIRGSLNYMMRTSSIFRLLDGHSIPFLELPKSPAGENLPVETYRKWFQTHFLVVTKVEKTRNDRLQNILKTRK